MQWAVGEWAVTGDQWGGQRLDLPCFTTRTKHEHRPLNTAH